MYSDDAQMTSKHGKNKEVHYEPQASSLTEIHLFYTITRNFAFEAPIWPGGVKSYELRNEFELAAIFDMP